MKVKLVEQNIDERFVLKGNRINVGDVIEVPKARGDELIKRKNFVEVKETKKSVSNT